MVQNSYTLLMSGIIFIVSLIIFVIGILKKNKSLWIPSLIFGLISSMFLLAFILLGLNGGM